jgi:pimeloyl-ACP methyl ester carboxylesterase
VVSLERNGWSDSIELAGQIHRNAHFVIGTEEQYVSLNHLAWQYETIPEAEVVWLEGADHGDLVLEPDRIVEAIMTFLHRLR